MELFNSRKNSDYFPISIDINTKGQVIIEDPNDYADWEWIEGYKGTDCLMRASHGSKFYYDIEKEYTCDGVPTLCCNGFHFCEELSNVFSYYRLDADNRTNRYFKVRALVDPSRDKTTDKTVAKKIILERELIDEEIYSALPKENLEDFPNFETFIARKDDAAYIEAMLSNVRHKLFNTKLNIPFVNIIDKKIIEKAKKKIKEEIHPHGKNYHFNMTKFLKYVREDFETIIALDEMDISLDMFVYLTMAEVDKI